MREWQAKQSEGRGFVDSESDESSKAWDGPLLYADVQR